MHVPSLHFDGTARTRDNAVVAGFPKNHAFTTRPARIRAKQKARGPDIYHSSQVTREIYAIRALVEQGNSGGPLLAPNGKVYGVVFAAALDNKDTGYVLTAGEVAPDATAGVNAQNEVSTQSCSD
jgi:S1-C subfamily serine protease